MEVVLSFVTFGSLHAPDNAFTMVTMVQHTQVPLRHQCMAFLALFSLVCQELSEKQICIHIIMSSICIAAFDNRLDKTLLAYHHVLPSLVPPMNSSELPIINNCINNKTVKV